MYRFRAKRSGEGEFVFADRHSYLRSKAATNYGPPKFCQAIEGVTLPMRQRREKDGAPWVTLVLGSGCVETPDDPAMRTVGRLPSQVFNALAERRELPDGTNPADLACRFTKSLIVDRVGHTVVVEEGDSDTGAVPDATAKLVLAAAMLTRLFHRLQSSDPTAMTRSGDDVASISPASFTAVDLEHTALQPLLTLLGELPSDPTNETDPERKTLATLLERIRMSLFMPGGRGALHGQQVRLLTELAWYALARKTTVYPGWSDLLFELSVHEDPPPIANGRNRPAFRSITEASPLLVKTYGEATAQSWETITQGRHTPRDDFYSSAAALLRTQAAVRAAEERATVKPPVASAFVTTFDLELEMALCASGPEPFVVALPVNVLVDSEIDPYRTAYTCWLGCVVHPDHSPGATPEVQLTRLRNPTEWFVLSSDERYEGLHADYPVVVRLNGCPLLKLPALTTGNGDELTHFGSELFALFRRPPVRGVSPELQHAVLVDEYAAMQQMAAQFIQYNATGGTDDIRRWGLPPKIAGVTHRGWARYWLVMGVQMSDSGVRYRLAAEMAARELLASQSAKSVQPKRSGLAVNRRIDPAVADLLDWYGFDVVRADCQEFTEDLRHYVEHLTTGQRATHERCTFS